MKKIIGVSIVFYFLLQINNLTFGQADRWIYIATGNKFNVYIDKTTIICDEYRFINAWVKYECISDCYVSELDKSLNYCINNIRFHLGKRMTTELSTMDYYTDGSNQSYRTSGSTLVIPDTILEVVYDYLNENYSCK